MNRRTTAFLIIAALVVSLLLAVGWSWLKQRPSDWRPRYHLRQGGPYHTDVWARLLQHATQTSGYRFTQLNTRRSWERALSCSPADSASYVFVGKHWYLNDSADQQLLLRWVAEGGTALVVAEQLPEGLFLLGNQADTIPRPNTFDGVQAYDDGNINSPYDALDASPLRAAGAVLHQPTSDTAATLLLSLQRNADTLLASWYHNTALAPNFVHIAHYRNPALRPYLSRLDLGAGHLYVHRVPLAFTNHTLLQREGFEHVQAVAALLPHGPILYDRFTALPSQPSSDSSNTTQQHSYLRFILGQPALRMAWYTLLGSLLLFLAFRARRRVPPIPVHLAPPNQTLAFVQLVGQLQMAADRQDLLPRQLWQQWEHWLLHRYGLSSTADAATVSARSGIPEPLLRQAADTAQQAFGRSNPATILRLHRSLHQCYRAAR